MIYDDPDACCPDCGQHPGDHDPAWHETCVAYREAVEAGRVDIGDPGDDSVPF